MVFGRVYSDLYDVLYGEKDYAGECDVLEHLFRSHGDGPVNTVLDLGCGTGSHAIPLAQRGYRVEGIDRSEAMLARAREKAAIEPLPNDAHLRFHVGDVRSADLGRTFDAAIEMFAVLGYQITNADVLAALRTARRHLRPGGLFIADVWFGPAVLRERPTTRVKVLEMGQRQVLRVADGVLDVLRQVCTVRYDLLTMEGDRVLSRTHEEHEMRFFFSCELDLLLHSAGFAPVVLRAFPHVDTLPGENTWNVCLVARAVEPPC